jgi:hypothetical protein
MKHTKTRSENMMNDHARIDHDERASKCISRCELRHTSRHNSSKRTLTKPQILRTTYSTFQLYHHSQQTKGKLLSRDHKDEHIVHFEVVRKMRKTKRGALNSDPRSGNQNQRGDERHSSTVSNSTYLSPIRRPKETSKMRLTSCDISVDFSSDAIHISSPRSVMDHFFFDEGTDSVQEQIDLLLMGTTSVESQTCVFLRPEPPKIKIPSLAPDRLCDTEHILDEGVVWKRILKDLKSIRSLQFLDSQDSVEQIIPAVNDKNVSLPIPSISRGAKKLNSVFDGNPRRLSLRSSFSHDNLTVSTSASSDPLSTTLLPAHNGETLDITVLDTRPPWRALVRQVSTLFLAKEMRWITDKDVASLLPQHAVLSTGAGNESCFFSCNNTKRRAKLFIFTIDFQGIQITEEKVRSPFPLIVITIERNTVVCF